MPAAVTDLCTVAQVRSHGQLPDGQTEQVPLIQELITDYSRTIMQHCQREFAPTVTATARTYAFDPCNRIAAFAAPWDLRAVTSVVVDLGQTEAVTLTATQYRLALPDEYDNYAALELDVMLRPTRWAERRLTVTGTWGFATVPEPAKRACVLSVLAALRGDIQAFAGPLQPNSVGPDANAPVALTPGVRGLLQPLCRPGGIA